MTDHVYKIIEITGSSPDSIEAAVQTALSRAGESLHNLRWFEVASCLSRGAPTAKVTRPL